MLNIFSTFWLFPSRPGKKDLPGTNTLAYLAHSVSDEANKLEYLSQASCYSIVQYF